MFLGEAIVTTTYLFSKMLSRIIKYRTPIQSLLDYYRYPNTEIVFNITS